MGKYLLFAIILLFPSISRAQEKVVQMSSVTGKVLSVKDFNPVSDVEVYIPYLKLLTVTGTDGAFELKDVRYGRYTLFIKDDNGDIDSMKILVDAANTDIGVLKVNLVASGFNETNRNPTIEVAENGSNDESDGAPTDQSISGILNAGRDPYVAAAAFTFSSFRYRMRGYNRDQLEVVMNGLLMNDVELGSAFFGQWGGLNDMFRNQNTTFSLQANEDGFGGLSGLTSINATAADQRKQVRVSYAASNRTYRNRIMASYSTGLMANGWAFAFDVSKRWAKEGYIPGTNYDGYSYYFGASKKLSNASILSFTTFGAPTVRGKSMASTKEAMDLDGSHFYNPNWGYLNGEKRNARENSAFQPVMMLNYDYKPNNSTKLGLVASYQTGYNGNSALDFYNAQDPRPDYYRNLPSYYETDETTYDPQKAAEVSEQWLNDPSVRQVNWDRMYEANRLNFDNVNGTFGKRSVYMVGQDRDDTRKYSFAANFQKVMSEYLSLSSGVSMIYQQTESYRKMLDLLGGDYYVNLNQFAERTYVGNTSFNQNDLNHPNGIIKEGDKYAYDYKSNFSKMFGWAQLIYTQRRFDLFFAARLEQDAFSRDGLYKNGLFPNESYGRSKNQTFLNYQLKGGVTYKIDGRNYLYANGSIQTAAPTFDNTFISARTRNLTIDKPRLEKIKSMDLGYILHTPKLNGRISGFATDIDDGTKITRFYHEDYRTFVNYVMQHVNIRHIGGEIALQAKISPSFSATAVATWAQVFYTSNADISIYRDNDTTTRVNKSIAYMKNINVATGPQSAYTLGLNYRSPKYWYANINFNYLNRNYVEVNPSRRTEEVVGLIPPESAQWHAILDQEELAAAFTVDLFVGKSFLLTKAMKWLPRGTSLYLNAGVNNILNNKNIQTGGFEQLRFDLKNDNPDRFPSKYSYGYGANYFINLSLKF